MSEDWPRLTDQDVLAARPPRTPVDPWRPYAFHVEPEASAAGVPEDVATIFLTNRECPFRCLMCDLWRYTTTETVPPGAVPAQIDYALEHLPPARHVKLYNSGNFFDRKAIPAQDRPAVAHRVRGFRTVIVENHPLLCGDEVLRFRDLLDGRLEVALGLETAHPGVLERLNKRMTLSDFAMASAFLRGHDVDVRAFVLVRPPFMTEAEGRIWAVRSMTWAFDAGVQCCSLVPTRGGNGIMERLAADGHFAPPSLASMEAVLEAGIRMQRGRVFMDEWDIERFAACPHCVEARRARLHVMNLTQTIPDRIRCACSRTEEDAG